MNGRLVTRQPGVAADNRTVIAPASRRGDPAAWLWNGAGGRSLQLIPRASLT